MGAEEEREVEGGGVVTVVIVGEEEARDGGGEVGVVSMVATEERDGGEEVGVVGMGAEEGVGADGSVSKCLTTTVTQEVVEVVERAGQRGEY